MTAHQLDDDAFLAVIRDTPLVSIDLIVRNPQGELLLGRRRNEPAKNWFFVPGGRVLKGESLDDAFERISHAELGLTLHRRDATLHGVYEHFYDTNTFEATDVSTHYIVLAHEITVSEPVSLDEQHHERLWCKSPDSTEGRQVHAYVKPYFATSARTARR